MLLPSLVGCEYRTAEIMLVVTLSEATWRHSQAKEDKCYILVDTIQHLHFCFLCVTSNSMVAIGFFMIDCVYIISLCCS